MMTLCFEVIYFTIHIFLTLLSLILADICASPLIALLSTWWCFAASVANKTWAFPSTACTLRLLWCEWEWSGSDSSNTASWWNFAATVGFMKWGSCPITRLELWVKCAADEDCEWSAATAEFRSEAAAVGRRKWGPDSEYKEKWSEVKRRMKWREE